MPPDSGAGGEAERFEAQRNWRCSQSRAGSVPLAQMYRPPLSSPPLGDEGKLYMDPSEPLIPSSLWGCLENYHVVPSMFPAALPVAASSPAREGHG